MSTELLFSVAEFKMSSNDNKENYWFEVNDTNKIDINAIVVPLFNTETNDHHDYWDDFVIADIKIIINLTQSHFENGILFKEELLSFEALLEQFDSGRHAYQLNIEFDIEGVSQKINFNHTYSVNFSYLFNEKEEEGQDLFRKIEDNTFFSTIVPFSRDGGWINGWK